MISPLLYILLIIFEVIFVFGIAMYMLFLIYSSLMGSPYVPSKNKLLKRIFDAVSFKKNSKFLDLGCGDGRVVMFVAKQYGASSVGVDINPMIIAWAKLKTRFKNLKNTEFRVENIFKTDLSGYDVVYIFLMPKLLIKLKPKLIKETKKNAVLISHGFKIEGWEKYCYKTLSDDPFNTYFYRITR